MRSSTYMFMQNTSSKLLCAQAFLPYLAMVKNPKIQSCDLDLWPMTLKVSWVWCGCQGTCSCKISLSNVQQFTSYCAHTEKNSDENITVRRYHAACKSTRSHHICFTETHTEKHTHRRIVQSAAFRVNSGCKISVPPQFSVKQIGFEAKRFKGRMPKPQLSRTKWSTQIIIIIIIIIIEFV